MPGLLATFILASVLTVTPTTSAVFHSRPMTVDGVEGVWLPANEAATLVEAASQVAKLREVIAKEDAALENYRRTVASSTTTASLLRQSATFLSDDLQRCTIALKEESSRCNDLWHQPVLPLGIGLVAGIVTCIGTAHALPR